ncbi:hypothetical protein MA16_Dca009030 [Dendrobium catenatum]|uniref:Uncharacterized protein n=1 Tax=Dendrobium catenatum TaxID=906689 RepID=A0A2I0VRB5_9ASPA|nr:hypothetical protein MA16_Dca009030 [Dendrobium catenatum]
MARKLGGSAANVRRNRSRRLSGQLANASERIKKSERNEKKDGRAVEIGPFLANFPAYYPSV